MQFHELFNNQNILKLFQNSHLGIIYYLIDNYLDIYSINFQPKTG